MLGVSGSGRRYTSAFHLNLGYCNEADCRISEGPRGLHRLRRGTAGRQYTQARTLNEARANLAEAVELVLEANRSLTEKSIAGKDVIREPLVPTAE